MKKKVVVVYSGGMDSFTLLNKVLSEGHEAHAITFDYGQRHDKEIEYAAAFCSSIDAPHTIVNMRTIGRELLTGSSQTSDIEVPEGHYAADNMKLTVVPNRNMIMLSMAIGYSISIDASAVYFGAHAGDHTIYPDCRPEFVEVMNQASLVGNWAQVEVRAPFVNLTKGDIAVVGKLLGIDYGQSWTCYNGREKACGKCGACQERKEAMAFANINDPMEYEA